MREHKRLEIQKSASQLLLAALQRYNKTQYARQKLAVKIFYKYPGKIFKKKAIRNTCASTEEADYAAQLIPEENKAAFNYSSVEYSNDGNTANDSFKTYVEAIAARPLLLRHTLEIRKKINRHNAPNVCIYFVSLQFLN